MQIAVMVLAVSMTANLSAVCLGTVIGVTQSVAMTLQSQISLDVLFRFRFPTALYLVLLALSMLNAVAAALSPTIKLIQCPCSY